MERQLWWAHLSTSNFEFDAFGETEHLALAALTRGCMKHADQRQVPRRNFVEYLDSDAHVMQVKTDVCYRDRDSEIK